MKKVLILALLFSIFNASGQYHLSGVVKDAKSKEGIFGATVFIPQSKLGTISETDGTFALDNIPTQQIEVIVSYEGYQEKRIQVHFEKPNQYLEVYLEEIPFELDEVIISTGLNKLQKDNVMKVAHKSLKNMERSGIQNLMDGIKQIPGVSALSTGTAISKPVIRGLTGNRVLVFNQGVRLENYQFGEEHGMGIDQAGISGVEIIKGPASLLYGSDALGGVVYLIPEKFAPENSTKSHFGSQVFSNTQGFHSTFGLKTSISRWRFLARGSYRLNGDYQIPGKQRVVNSANHSQDIKLGIGYSINNVTTDIRYNYNHSINGMAHSFDAVPLTYRTVGKYQDLFNHNVSIKNDIKFHISNLKTNIGFSGFTRRLIDNDETHIGMTLKTVNADLKWYFPYLTEKLDWIVGSQLMWQVNHNFGEHFLLPNAVIRNAGFFTNLNYKLHKFLLQGGLRYDFRHIHTETIDENRTGFDKNLGSLTGAFGVKTELTDNMNLRFNIASGFRAPNLAELSSFGEHENKIEIGDSNLKNEQNIQVDINWDYRSTHFEFFINGFYNRIKNYIYLQEQTQYTGLLPVYKYIQHDARLYGGEAGVHFHPHPWDWLHINSSFETVTGQKFDDSYLPLIPADQWKNEFRIQEKIKGKFADHFYIFMQINHTFDNRSNDVEDLYPAYTLWNSGAGLLMNFKNTTGDIRISVQNLTDKRYISNLSVLREDNIPNQGRNIILGLNINF